MRILEYKENKIHGSFEFPVEAYYVNEQHPRYKMPLHWHEEFEIIQILSGYFDYEIGQKSGSAQSGEILFVNGGEFHSGTPNRCEYRCIVFDLGFLLKEDNTAGSKMLAPFFEGDYAVSLERPKNDALIYSILSSLFGLLTEKPRGFELQVQGFLYQLFGLIIQNRYFDKNTGDDLGNKKRLSQLKSALALIEKEYSTPITLQQLARSADMSPKYFCQFFKQMTHYSPITYLNRHRVEVACYKLISGWQNMTELSFECGFNDLSYFIRVFRSIVGTTPKQYARKHRLDSYS
jgi:AraC-like DNA-binding protein